MSVVEVAQPVLSELLFTSPGFDVCSHHFESMHRGESRCLHTYFTTTTDQRILRQIELVQDTVGEHLIVQVVIETILQRPRIRFRLNRTWRSGRTLVHTPSNW